MNLLPAEAWSQAVIARLFPRWQARRTVQQLFVPPPAPRRAWEQRAETSAVRECIATGLSLLRWQDEARPTRGRVLLVHGWGSRASQMAGLAPQLLDQAYTVYALDAPAHGHSLGQSCSPFDYAQAITRAAEHIGPLDALIAHGSGAAAAALACDRGLEPVCMVLLAAPYSLRLELQEQFRRLSWSTQRYIHFYHQLEQCLGSSLEQLDVADTLSRKSCPLFLVHDRDDMECSANNMTQLAQCLPHAETWLTQGLGHRKLLRSVEVQHRIARFINSTGMRVATAHLARAQGRRSLA